MRDHECLLSLDSVGHILRKHQFAYTSLMFKAESASFYPQTAAVLALMGPEATVTISRIGVPEVLLKAVVFFHRTKIKSTESEEFLTRVTLLAQSGLVGIRYGKSVALQNPHGTWIGGE